MQVLRTSCCAPQPSLGGPLRDPSRRKPRSPPPPQRLPFPSEDTIIRLSRAMREAHVICLEEPLDTCLRAWKQVETILDNKVVRKHPPEP